MNIVNIVKTEFDNELLESIADNIMRNIADIVYR